MRKTLRFWKKNIVIWRFPTKKGREREKENNVISIKIKQPCQSQNYHSIFSHSYSISLSWVVDKSRRRGKKVENEKEEKSSKESPQRRDEVVIRRRWGKWTRDFEVCDALDALFSLFSRVCSSPTLACRRAWMKKKLLELNSTPQHTRVSIIGILTVSTDAHEKLAKNCKNLRQYVCEREKKRKKVNIGEEKLSSENHMTMKNHQWRIYCCRKKREREIRTQKKRKSAHHARQKWEKDRKRLWGKNEHLSSENRSKCSFFAHRDVKWVCGL